MNVACSVRAYLSLWGLEQPLAKLLCEELALGKITHDVVARGLATSALAYADAGFDGIAIGRVHASIFAAQSCKCSPPPRHDRSGLM